MNFSSRERQFKTYIRFWVFIFLTYFVEFKVENNQLYKLCVFFQVKRAKMAGNGEFDDEEEEDEDEEGEGEEDFNEDEEAGEEEDEEEEA